MRVYLSWIGSDSKKNRMTSGGMLFYKKILFLLNHSFKIFIILKVFNNLVL